MHCTNYCGGAEAKPGYSALSDYVPLFRGWSLDQQTEEMLRSLLTFCLARLGLCILYGRQEPLVAVFIALLMQVAACSIWTLPSTDCDVQELISAWHNQAQTHAFIAAPGSI